MSEAHAHRVKVAAHARSDSGVRDRGRRGCRLDRARRLDPPGSRRRDGAQGHRALPHAHRRRLRRRAPRRAEGCAICAKLPEIHRRSVENCRRAGVKIVFGTDAGGFPWTEVPQAREFELEVAHRHDTHRGDPQRDDLGGRAPRDDRSDRSRREGRFRGSRRGLRRSAQGRGHPPERRLRHEGRRGRARPLRRQTAAEDAPRRPDRRARLRQVDGRAAVSPSAAPPSSTRTRSFAISTAAAGTGRPPPGSSSATRFSTRREKSTADGSPRSSSRTRRRATPSRRESTRSSAQRSSGASGEAERSGAAVAVAEASQLLEAEARNRDTTGCFSSSLPNPSASGAGRQRAATPRTPAGGSSSQISPVEAFDRAADVIVNDGTLDELEKKVDALWGKWMGT